MGLIFTSAGCDGDIHRIATTRGYRYFSLIPVVVFPHSVLQQLKWKIMRISVLYATAFYG